VFHPPALLAGWAEGQEPSSRLVIIARDLNKEPVEKMFHAFMAQ
jgi:G3E family GTPase